MYRTQQQQLTICSLPFIVFAYFLVLSIHRICNTKTYTYRATTTAINEFQIMLQTKGKWNLYLISTRTNENSIFLFFFFYIRAESKNETERYWLQSSWRVSWRMMFRMLVECLFIAILASEYIYIYKHNSKYLHVNTFIGIYGKASEIYSYIFIYTLFHAKQPTTLCFLPVKLLSLVKQSFRYDIVSYVLATLSAVCVYVCTVQCAHIRWKDSIYWFAHVFLVIPSTNRETITN